MNQKDTLYPRHSSSTHHVGIVVAVVVVGQKTRWKKRDGEDDVRCVVGGVKALKDTPSRLVSRPPFVSSSAAETSIHGWLRYTHAHTRTYALFHSLSLSLFLSNTSTTIAERIFRRAQATTANYQARGERRVERHEHTTPKKKEKASPSRPREKLRACAAHAFEFPSGGVNRRGKRKRERERRVWRLILVQRSRADATGKGVNSWTIPRFKQLSILQLDIYV